MRRKTAVVLGVSGAALALTASSAFTAGGLTIASGVVGFIGGSQTVTSVGTEISGVSYTHTSNKISKVTFTFSDDNAAGKSPTLSIDLTTGSDLSWNCSAITSASPYTSDCEPASGVTGPSETNVDGVTVTVA